VLGISATYECKFIEWMAWAVKKGHTDIKIKASLFMEEYLSLNKRHIIQTLKNN